MNYNSKSKGDLIKELDECKKRISELEKIDAERKKIEEELKESEERFRKMFGISPDLLALIDKNGVFIEANPAMRKSLGKNPIGKSIFEVLPKEIAESRMEKIKGVIENNEVIIFEDSLDAREFINTLLPITLERKRYCMVIAREITEMKRMNRFLRTINEINSLIVYEKNSKKLFEKASKLLAGLRAHYSVWIGLRENGKVSQIAHYDELKPHLERLAIKDLTCFKEAINERKAVIRKKEERIKTCPFYDSLKNHSCLIFPMIVDNETLGFLTIHSTYTLPNADEIDFLQTLANDLAFANKAIELDEAKRKAYRQIGKNIEEFAILVDQIRNPLSIISGTAELNVKDEKIKKILLEGVERINRVVGRLDEGWLESEEVRKFLKKYLT
jgi:PAS domain S-box-containing protein